MADDLAKIIADAFNNDSDLSSSCPGGAVVGVPPSDRPRPYCEIVINEGSLDLKFESGWTGTREIRFNVYGDTGSSVKAVLDDILELFDQHQDTQNTDDGDLSVLIRTGFPQILQPEGDPNTFFGTVAYDAMMAGDLKTNT